MAGSLSAMPLIVLNMGGEMIYILQQRLEAQKIPLEKSSKVLADILKAMFAKKFIAELLRPQELYSNSSTKQIFDRLAHSSIMRLNQSSMDKLYDLMIMGFKQQWISTREPSDLVLITKNHLSALRTIAATDDTCKDLLSKASEQILSFYEDLSEGDMQLLDGALASFFQAKKIKVSLFLQSGAQHNDGTLVLKNSGPVGKNCVVPGTIRYFDPAGKEIKEKSFKIESAKLFSKYDPDAPFTAGANLYNQPTPSSSTAESKSATSSKDAKKGIDDKAEKKGYKGGEESGTTSMKAELNLLADLLGPLHRDADEKGQMKINLFAADPFDFDNDAEYSPTTDVIVIDGKNDHKTVAKLMKDLELDDKKDDKGAEDKDEKDLLSLMDDAVK